MTTTPDIPADQIAPLVDIASQRATAQLAQELFAILFRHSFGTDAENARQQLSHTETEAVRWCEQGSDTAQQLARLALLVHGLDQWGLAYVQAFRLTALPGLSALVSTLRLRLTPQLDALFEQQFARISDVETDAIDFKIVLRREIHLALWHAMAACEQAQEAEEIVATLGSLMRALDQQMPTLGWRLVSDALAHIQIAVLNSPELSDLARESTQKLFDALVRELPKETSLKILRHAGEAVVAWQNERRQSSATALH